MLPLWRATAFLMLAALAGSALGAEPEKPAKPVDPQHAEKMRQSEKLFVAKVREILRGKCLRCHGGEKVESEFSLATREALLAGGVYSEENVVPGQPERSFLLKTITHAEDPKMPEDGEPLSEAEVASIREWIALGAAYDEPLVKKDDDPLAWTRRKVDDDAREHWSLRPLARPVPPAMNDRWARTPIDQFVLARLKEQGLVPNPIADKRTLIRRATLDLIGLPPTPEEVEAFLKDDAPDAYERVLDRLLASPHFGERWGRHWLDVARFAESHGFEQDYDRPYAYHYRDFVIEAFNRDMPYDQFVRWQLAGDEIEPEDPLALKATGFLGAGVFPTQITLNEVERTRYDAIDDMAATTGTAFLGLTIGCARCHDHKYDPIPQADYYRFASTFVTTVRSNQPVNIDPEGYKQAKAAFDREHAPLVAELKRFEREELPARQAEWEKTDPAARIGQAWQILDVEAKSAGGATFTKLDDGSLLASGTNPDFDTYTLTAVTLAERITGLRIEALAHPSLVKGGPGRAANGNIALTDVRLTAQPIDGSRPAVEVKLQKAQATFEQKPHLLAAKAIDNDKKSGWALDPQFGKDHAVAFETAGEIGFAGGTRLVLTLEFQNNKQHNIGRPRISITTAPTPLRLDAEAVPALAAQAINKPDVERTDEERSAVTNWYRTLDPQWQALHARVQAHLAKAPEPKLETMMICSEGVTPIRHHTQGPDFFNEFYFCARGDTNKKQGLATQSFLQVLMTAPEGEKHWQTPPPDGWRTSYRRRAMADWITDTEYGAGHLLARVIVNRLWQHHLGRGIVATPSDFGKQGAPPSHPELLEWLARDLIDNGWKLKRVHKQIMLSSTYMQTSTFDAERSRKDELNQYCWRFAPRRLEAEVIRDSLLAVSGQLDRTMFGPGTLDEGHRRRSIYFMIKRSQLIPMMTLFDAPEPLVSVGERPATTIAPQALAFMNNPHVRSWARALGDRLLPAAEQSIEEAVREGYRITLVRPPDATELAATTKFIERQRDSYAESGKPQALKLALADFAQVLMSLNELIYVE